MQIRTSVCVFAIPVFVQSGVFRHWWCQLVGNRVVLIETLQPINPRHSPGMDNQNDNNADQVNATMGEVCVKNKTPQGKVEVWVSISLICFLNFICCCAL